MPTNTDVDFCPLHVHGVGSILDSAIQPKALASKIKSLGMRSVALTDHGTMFGIIPFYSEMRKEEIHPVLGVEMYVSPGTCISKDRDPYGRLNYHLVVLAETLEGYFNLCRLVTKANTMGFYYKPRVDFELLEEYSKGLIGLSGCIQGHVPSALIRGDKEQARALAERYSRIFGPNNFFLEVQNHGMQEEQVARAGLYELADGMGLPVVATNDSHYLEKRDARIHDVLLCVQTGKTLDAKNRMRMPNDEFYIRSAEEMAFLFKDRPDALSHTIDIADRCQVELPLGTFRLPRFPLEHADNADDELERLAMEGLVNRLRIRQYRDNAHKAEVWQRYRARVQYELDVIREMGFAGYFLIVRDFIQWAKGQGIPVGPGRGSAAGSLAAYSLGITNLDPMPYGLLFERFLNPQRVSMPDIDCDFCMNGREAVLGYVAEKYGRDTVSMITTFGRMMARGAIRDVGRVMGLPIALVDKVAKTIPEGPGASVVEALTDNAELRLRMREDPSIEELLTTAASLEGTARHVGVHAAGVVIGDRPLEEIVPLYVGKNGERVTQYEMSSVEKVGLVKFDFLGLRTLTVIDQCLKNLAKRGIDLDVDSIPMEDGKVFEMLGKGETDGVFQLESAGIRDLLRRLKPNTFEELIALVALYRPGPLNSGMVESFVRRKHGKEAVEYPFDLLKPVLETTFGVFVYQEQVMQAAQVLAGYSLGEADLLRRAMGKKKAEEMDKQKDRFLRGAAEKGLNLSKAEEVFGVMAMFAEYGFNKSHAAAYALITSQTAYLKCYYPAEFMAAVLTSEAGDTDKIREYIRSCRRSGIEVCPPNINQSAKEFCAINGKILYGLGAVKNIGNAAVESLLAERDHGGDFKSLSNLCDRCAGLGPVTRRVLESLVLAGACDGWDGQREQYLAVLDVVLKQSNQRQRDSKNGQGNLFEAWGKNTTEESEVREDLPKVTAWDVTERLKREKEVLGLYLSTDPLDDWRACIGWCETSPERYAELLNNDMSIRLGGLWAGVREHVTKKAKHRMATGILETTLGEKWQVVVFPELYAQVANCMEEDRIVIVQGRSEDRAQGEHRLIAERVVPVEKALEVFNSGVWVLVDARCHDSGVLRDIAEVVLAEEGPCPVMLCVRDEGGRQISIKPSARFRMNVTPTRLQRLAKSVEPGGAIRLV